MGVAMRIMTKAPTMPNKLEISWRQTSGAYMDRGMVSSWAVEATTAGAMLRVWEQSEMRSLLLLPMTVAKASDDPKEVRMMAMLQHSTTTTMLLLLLLAFFILVPALG